VYKKVFMTSIPLIDKTWQAPSVPHAKEEETWFMVNPGRAKPTRISTFRRFQYYTTVNEELPKCLVHPEKEPGEMTTTDMMFCPDMIRKIGGFGLDRTPSQAKFDHLEQKLSPENRAAERIDPGDAFLVMRREEAWKCFTSPEIPLPSTWKPSNPNAPLWEQRKEQVAAWCSLNESRSRGVVSIVWDFFTVRTTNGWRRKTVVYEKGTPSPFEFQYYDTR